MELQIGLPLTTYKDPYRCLLDHINNQGFKPKRMSGCLDNKRSNEEAFKKVQKEYSSSSPNSLPLLVWSGQPNEEDDDPDRREKKTISCSINMNIADEGKSEHVIVGWPPIKSSRRKLLHPNQGGLVIPNTRRAGHVDTRKVRIEAADESLSGHRQRRKLTMY